MGIHSTGIRDRPPPTPLNILCSCIESGRKHRRLFLSPCLLAAGRFIVFMVHKMWYTKSREAGTNSKKGKRNDRTMYLVPVIPVPFFNVYYSLLSITNTAPADNHTNTSSQAYNSTSLHPTSAERTLGQLLAQVGGQILGHWHWVCLESGPEPLGISP